MPINTTPQKSPVPCALIILDGFGLSDENEYNAVFHAKTPTLDMLKKSAYYATISASGTSVGLPENYIGNSEVGHLTIGTGRIVPQSLLALNTATCPHNLVKNNTFYHLFNDYYQKNKAKIHLIGMISDAGIHSHIQHIINYIQAIQEINPDAEIIMHYILDGRDVSPHSAYFYILQIEQSINSEKTKIGSLHGRFYAMDRDKNTTRTEQSGAIFLEQQTVYPGTVKEYIESQQNISDEFIQPQAFITDHTINKNDIVLFANYRLDRMTQIAKYIQNHCQPKHIITPIPYKQPIKSTALYKPKVIENGLIKILCEQGNTILSIAETEKHAHVSYFFNGGSDTTFKNETRIFIPSKKEKSYANNPNMSAQEITNTVLDHVQNKPHDFYLINYANADMVGHSGDFEATVQAIELLDKQIKILYEEIVIKQGGTLFITADHGNAEKMINPQTKEQHTAHTTNKVPFYAVNANINPKKMQGLKDVAPCILKHFGIDIPEEMLSTSDSCTMNNNDDYPTLSSS